MLLLENVEVHEVHRDDHHREEGDRGGGPHDAPNPIEHLVLHPLPCVDVDDGEDAGAEEAEDPSRDVHGRVPERKLGQPPAQNGGLRKASSAAGRVEGHEGARAAGHGRRAQLRLRVLGRRQPPVQNPVDGQPVREVGIGDVQEVPSQRLPLRQRRSPHAGHVVHHANPRATICHTAFRQDHGVLEKFEDPVGRLVNRAEHKHVRVRDDIVEQPGELEGGGAVQGTCRLVQDHHRRPLHHGLRDAEPLLLPAGEPLPHEVPDPGVLAGGEPRLGQDVVHELLSLLGLDAGAEQLRRVLHGLARRQHAPQQGLLPDNGRATGEAQQREGLAVQHNPPAHPVALPSLQRKHVQQGRLACAAPAHDRHHAASLRAARHVAEDPLGLALLRLHRVGHTREH
mmetsp:Transcript_72293/g.202908  ORF Transcript_72293/g.202908 Transcript_72293/m.202908 type:complete len:397 (+) Transcript_72293:821-2011(+)